MHGITTLASLGAALRAERERAGLTQGQLATRAGVSRATVIALESGSRFETVTLLATMKALGLAIQLVPVEGPSQRLADLSQTSQYDPDVLDDTEEL
ncbi:helix-turn-helix transcriptional regulator [Demequina sp. SO4-18]|uniref:helix-turn-helix transcriptional regulator n=1 Tax=Demequina sp. SO4-18 TaxID=3401026 RepID=UPI003B5CCDD9